MQGMTIIILIGLVGLVAVWVMRHRPQQTRSAEALVLGRGVAQMQLDLLGPEVRAELIDTYAHAGSDETIKRLQQHTRLPQRIAEQVVQIIAEESMRQQRDRWESTSDAAAPAPPPAAPDPEHTAER